MIDKPKILVVDDEEDILIETKDIFEKKGYIVFTALDSDNALELYQKEKPDICILDVHMPKSKLDGIGVLDEIRKLNRASYCIMLSRIDEKDKIEAARKLAADRYVLKPIDYPELLGLIDEAVKAIQKHIIRGEVRDG